MKTAMMKNGVRMKKNFTKTEKTSARDTFSSQNVPKKSGTVNNRRRKRRKKP